MGRRQTRTPPNSDIEIRHGSRTAYVYHMCRCDLCVTEQRKRAHEYYVKVTKPRREAKKRKEAGRSLSDDRGSSES